jgi:hypothetical protein
MTTGWWGRVRHALRVKLRPLLVSRVASAVPGAGIVVAGVGTFSGGTPALCAGGIVGSVLVGVLLAVRGFRLGVDCRDDVVIVRGLVWNRRIPRRAVAAVTDFPALRWRDERGRIRWTPVIAFAELGGSIPVVARHNGVCVDRLRQLLWR